MPVYKSKETTKSGRAYYFKVNYDDYYNKDNTMVSKKYDTMAEAKQAELEFLIQSEKLKKIPTKMTFGELYEKFLEHKKKIVKYSTFNSYNNILGIQYNGKTYIDSNHVLSQIENEEKIEKICFENAKDIYILNIPDILFIKTEKILGSNSDLRIVTAREDIIIKGKLKSIESQYGKDFSMPNRSVLVNINHIIKMLRNKIELDNGEIITISRKRATEIKPVVIEKLRRDMKK